MPFLSRINPLRTTPRPAPARHDRTLGPVNSLERLEVRTLFASFTATSVPDLIADINAANRTAAADTITLAPGETFTLTAINNFADGTNGLPVIRGSLTIVGHGRTIQRSAAAYTPSFRLFDVPAG